MIGRFIKQYNVRFFEGYLSKCNPALLTTCNAPDEKPQHLYTVSSSVKYTPTGSSVCPIRMITLCTRNLTPASII